MLNLLGFMVLIAANSVSASPAIAARACNADNCLRAIEAAAFVTRQGALDCSSYFRTTITPATVTITKILSQTTNKATSTTKTAVATSTQLTTTIYTTQVAVTSVETDLLTYTITELLLKRLAAAVPTSIPAYASACSGSARYSSACSCVGAKKSTVTAAAPSTTVTITKSYTQVSTYVKVSTSTKVTTKVITSTAVVTSTADQTTSSIIYATTTLSPALPTCSAFFIQVASGALAGRYANLYQITNPDDNTLAFSTSISDASIFALDPDGSLLHVDTKYGGIQGNGGVLYFYGRSKVNPDFTELACTIGVGNILSCSSQGATIFQTCGSYGPNLGADVGIEKTLGSNCNELTFQAVGVSSC